MSTELPPLKREKLLEGLDIQDLSMADVQSLLHWANNRCCCCHTHLSHTQRILHMLMVTESVLAVRVCTCSA